MRSPTIPARGRGAWFVVVACVTLVGLATSAAAHSGHSANAVATIGHVDVTARAAVDLLAAASPHRLELHAPGCPGDEPGHCRCTPDAHAPLPSVQFALPAPTPVAPPAPVARPVAEAPASSVSRPLVIGSRGSRGPPSP